MSEELQQILANFSNKEHAGTAFEALLEFIHQNGDNSVALLISIISSPNFQHLHFSSLIALKLLLTKCLDITFSPESYNAILELLITILSQVNPQNSTFQEYSHSIFLDYLNISNINKNCFQYGQIEHDLEDEFSYVYIRRRRQNKKMIYWFACFC